MMFSENDWDLYFIALVIIALVGINEMGYGVIAFLPLTLLAYWLMRKAIEG